MRHWLITTLAALTLATCSGSQAMAQSGRAVPNGSSKPSITITSAMLKQCQSKLNHKAFGSFSDQTWRMIEPLKNDPKITCLKGSKVGFTDRAYYSTRVELVSGTPWRGERVSLYWCSFIQDQFSNETHLGEHQVGMPLSASAANQAQQCGLAVKQF